MTIFDNFRYPIKDHMTWSDVNDLPEQIWETYLEHPGRDCQHNILHHAANQALLKQIIQDYNT